MGTPGWVGCSMLDGKGQNTVLEEKKEVKKVGEDFYILRNFDRTWVMAGIIP